MPRVFKSILLSSISIGGFVSAPAYAQANRSTAEGIEEIVVTAQKREQNLQDVPVSISAVTAQQLMSNRVQTITDLSALTPNLTIRPGAGGSKIPQYSMRGIYTFGSAIGTDKGISLYIDGVYIQSVIGSAFEFADIERVEVLRGPQGTLFGRNSTGGAISVMTRNPTGEFGVRQELTYGNYNQLRSKTRVDLPQFGPFSATMSYLHSERDGDVRNRGAGTTFDYGPASGGRLGKLTSPKRLGSDNVEGVFAAVKADLHPDLDLSYKFDYAQNDFTPQASGIDYLAGPSVVAFGGTPPSLAAFGLYNASPIPKTPISKNRPKAVNNAYSMTGYNKAYGHSLTAKWVINDQISVKNILSYRYTELRNISQLDGLGGLRAGSLPFIFIGTLAYSKEKQWSDEFQLNITTDWFNLTAGAIHFHNNQIGAGLPGTFNTVQGTALVGQNTTATGTPFVIPGNPGYQSARVKVNSDAVFVQPEFHLTDKLDLVGGLRITRDKKRGIEYFPGTIAAPSAGRSSPIRYNDSEPTYLVGVNYKPARDLLVYAKYSTGYISGGQIATIAFAPERASSYEGGIKTDLFGRRVRSNLAVFYVNYSSIQQATLGALTGIPSAAPFSVAIVPSADARAKGFEWENIIVPMRGLTLTANVGYTDFKFDPSTVFSGFVLQAGAGGFREFNRPKWTGNFAADYRIDDVFGDTSLNFRLDANFRSKSLMAADVTPGTGAAAQVDPAYLAAATQPFQWLLNGRIALRNVNIGGAKTQIALWGKNLLDDKDPVQFTGLGFTGVVLYQQARTYGVDLSIEF